jgi:hypothetical protein
MRNDTSVRVLIPRELKRSAFSELALRGETFSSWLRRELESLVDRQKPERSGPVVHPYSPHQSEYRTGGR